MRGVLLGLAVSMLTGHAAAADFLRGSTYEGAPTRGFDWSGFYVGGHGGYANTDFMFEGATRSMVAHEARHLLVEQEHKISEYPNLPKRDGRGVSYGGFFGFNKQWNDVVLGIEASYSRTSIGAESTDLIGRSMTASNELLYNVRLESHASATLTDYASLRVRAGYAIDWLMPFITAGVAIGHVKYSRSVAIEIDEYDVSDDTPVLVGQLNRYPNDIRDSALTAGFMAGAGVDLALTRNIFVRAEYEYMYLSKVGDIDFHVNTVRGAVGVKF